jgi:hypothetical protein
MIERLRPALLADMARLVALFEPLQALLSAFVRIAVHKKGE